MSTHNDGGPAFPIQDHATIHAYALAKLEGITAHHERDRVYIQAKAEAIGGMSLRAYFAGQALAGLRVGDWTHDTHAAKYCCDMADALIAELNKPKEAAK